MNDANLKVLVEIRLSQLLTSEVEALSCVESGAPSLEDFLKRNGDPAEEERVNILQRIAQTVMQFHTKAFLCNKPSHSQITVMKTFFTNSTLNRRSEEEMKSDILLLANLYCSVLTKGQEQKYSEKVTEALLKCSCPDIALDIIKKMATKTIAINEILEHPFHWSDQQKVLFLCRAFDFVNAKMKVQEEKAKEETERLNTNKKCAVKNVNIKEKEQAKKEKERAEREKKILNDYKMGEEFNVFPDTGWFEQLKLPQGEIKDINSTKDTSTQYSTDPSRRLICNLALKSLKKEDKKKVLFELLRFFRNRYAHFDEDPDDVKKCFKNYPAGYLKFFACRFPNLFMHVYSNMKTYLCKKNDVGEFANLTFSQPLFNINMHARSENPSS